MEPVSDTLDYVWDRELSTAVITTAGYLTSEAGIGRYWRVESYAIDEYGYHVFTLNRFA